MIANARIVAALAFCAITSAALQAQAQEIDLSEYTPLLNRSIEAHMAAQGASPEARPALLEDAIARDTELIQWLEALLGSPQFQQLDAEDQTAYATGHARAEFNRAAALIQVSRCDEAREHVRALLARSQIEPELRAALTSLGEEAVACASPPPGSLRISATPADAEILIDGVSVGDAAGSHEVASGSHLVVVRADGFESQELTVTVGPAESVPVTVTLAPVAAAAASESASAEPAPHRDPSRGKSPLWYEWTLWGVGAAGVTTALVFFFRASDIESQLDETPEARIADPEAEQQLADDNYVMAYVFGGIGLAAAITGTVLYLVRDSEEAPPTLSAAPWLRTGMGVTVSVRF